KVPVQSLSNMVAIEQDRMRAPLEEARLDKIGGGGFAGPGKSGKPEDRRLLMLDRCAGRLGRRGGWVGRQICHAPILHKTFLARTGDFRYENFFGRARM